MIHRLRQRIARDRRLVALLCLAVVLQGLAYGAWHFHASGHDGSHTASAHMEHAEAHQASHADAVEIESLALLKFFGGGLGLILVASLLIPLPRKQAIRPALTTPALRSSSPRLRPPERAPPLA